MKKIIPIQPDELQADPKKLKGMDKPMKKESYKSIMLSHKGEKK